MSDKRSDLKDRMMDLALQEKLGKRQPPDFFEKVQRRQSQQVSGRSARTLAVAAVAVSLFLGLGVLSAYQSGSSSWPNAYWHSDDSRYLAENSNPKDTLDEAMLQALVGPRARVKFGHSMGQNLLSGKETGFDTVTTATTADPKEFDAYIIENLITSTVAPQTWDKNGGAAQTTFSLDSLSLEVNQSQTVHNQGDPSWEGLGDHLWRGLYGREDSTEGRGPQNSGDKFRRIIENPFHSPFDRPLSTFSIDVDTASYSKVRTLLLDHGTMPPPDAVRIEEMINYFSYDYAGPKDDQPFAVHVEVTSCPWQPKHRLLRIALMGKSVHPKERPASNLVFLLDVSGSMNEERKLPLVKRGMQLLTQQLGKRDRVAIVVYAGASGLALESTPCTSEGKEKIHRAIESLRPGGSTNGEAGIHLAYHIAADHFIKGGTNRVILCTDGDFNVGTSGSGELERLVEAKAKTGVFLTALGFGVGNHNDEMMEVISNKGNGNYGFVDSINEARKAFVQELSGTLVTIAKDVKIQVEFNPVLVAGYRLIGYENRRMAKEDFNDDKKDAGEIGAGHRVTAFYEIVPAGEPVASGEVDELEFQRPGSLTEIATTGGAMMMLKLRYKQPDGEKSTLVKIAVKDAGGKFADASGELKFASAVAGFGMILRNSKYQGNMTLDALLEIATAAQGEDKHHYRAEFLEMVKAAAAIGKVKTEK